MSKHLSPSSAGGTDVHSLLKQSGCERGWQWYGGTKCAKALLEELQILPGDRSDRQLHCGYVVPHHTAHCCCQHC